MNENEKQCANLYDDAKQGLGGRAENKYTRKKGIPQTDNLNFHFKKRRTSFSGKRPELTLKNGALFTRPRKPHKIMQIKRFKSSFTLRTLVRLPRP